VSRIYVVTVEGRRRWHQRSDFGRVERCPSDHAPADRRVLADAREARANVRAERLHVIERALLDAIAERYAAQNDVDGGAWLAAYNHEQEAKVAYLAHVHPGVPWWRVLGLP